MWIDVTDATVLNLIRIAGILAPIWIIVGRLNSANSANE